MAATNAERLAFVGPRDPVHGYPMWYEDAAGTRLELGVGPGAGGGLADPFTPAIGDVPQPGVPLSVPANFPDESFYFMAESRMDVGGADGPVRARLILAVEAAFGGTGAPDAGARVVFSRIRVRVDDLIPLAEYQVTHPYGQTELLQADDRGRLFDTEDRGIADEQFDLILRSGLVAPFLRWDTGAPTGYLGDGVTEHRVTGSPFGTNFFRLAGPGVGRVPGANPADPDVIETDLFTVQGRLARRLGVEVTGAGYRRTAGGVIDLDLFAHSAPGQQLELANPRVAFADRDRDYSVRARVPAVPANVEVVNASDRPPTRVTVPVTDQVVLTRATWSTSARTLTVAARSTDATGPQLQVVGFGPMTGPVTVFPADACSAEIVVESAAGGRSSRRVLIAQGPLPELPVRAIALSPDRAIAGRTVALDGSGSLGPITGYAWSQVSGTPVSLSDPGDPAPTFTAPAAGSLVFRLTVTGSGGPDSADVTVPVQPTPPPDVLNVDSVQFRTSRQQYRVSGTVAGDLPNEVVVSRLGTELGRSPVDPTGAWDVRLTLTAATAALRPSVGDLLEVTSTGGGSASVPVNIRN